MKLIVAFLEGGLSIPLCDAIFGHHDSDIVLNAALYPNEFKKHINELPTFKQKGFIETINAPHKMKVRSRPIFNLIKRLPSFLDTTITVERTKELKNPESFNTKCGLVHLLHKDASVAQHDSNLIEDINKRFFYLLFEDTDHKNENLFSHIKKGEFLDKKIPQIISQGSTIILTDKEEDSAVATITDLKHVNPMLGSFAQGVINLKKDYSYLLREKLVEKIFILMERIRYGGKIYISEQSACLFPYGKDGFKVLLEIAGFKTLIAKHKFLVAIKE